MAAMAKMEITLDAEAKAAIEGLAEQIKALRDLLETKAGTENHYHYYHQPTAGSAVNPWLTQPQIWYTNHA